MASKALIATALLSCALVLSGCSGDPQPKEPPKSSTPSPVATAPAMPSEASEASEEGAVAFVKHYIELLNYAANTGDVKPLKQASDPKCEGCNSYIDQFEKVYESGNKFQGIDWRPTKASVKNIKSGFAVWTNVEATEDEGEVVTYKLYFETDNKPDPLITAMYNRASE